MRFSMVPGLVAVAAAGALLTGCVSPQHPLEADYGVALRSNFAAQVADPEPRYVRELEPASSGARAATASLRYKHGQVIQPVAQTTSEVGGSSGGGSSAGAAPSGSR
jgi:type IV pilus biogenesis protein CpaD/CtpE